MGDSEKEGPGDSATSPESYHHGLASLGAIASCGARTVLLGTEVPIYELSRGQDLHAAGAGCATERTITAHDSVCRAGDGTLEELDVLRISAGVDGKMRRHHEKCVRNDAIKHGPEFDIGECLADTSRDPAILLEYLCRNHEFEFVVDPSREDSRRRPRDKDRRRSGRWCRVQLSSPAAGTANRLADIGDLDPGAASL